MGFELNRIMKQYGVGTPGQVNYSGSFAPSVPTAPAGTRPADAGAAATYDKQLADFNTFKTDPAAFNETMRKYGLDQKSYDTYKTDYQNRLQNAPMYVQKQFDTGNRPVSNATYDTTGSYYGNQLKSPTYGAVPASMINATPQEKSDYYLQQRNLGYNNADLRTASENTFGKVNEGDWAQMTAGAYPTYNQNIVDAYKSIGRSWDAGTIDAPGYNYWMNQVSSGAFNPKDLNSTFAQIAADEKAKATVKAYTGGSVNELAAKYAQGGSVFSPGQAAAYYKQRAQDGYTDSEIRAASDNLFGVSSDADWQYIKSIANVSAAPMAANMAPINIAGTDYSGGGGDSYVDPNPGWSGLSKSQQASYFADPKNHTEADLRGLAQKGFTGYTTLGLIQNLFSPSIPIEAAMINAGIDPDTGLQGQGSRGQTGLHGDKGVGFNPDGSVRGYDPSVYDSPTSYDPNPNPGVTVGGAIPDQPNTGIDLGSVDGTQGGFSNDAGGTETAGSLGFAQGGRIKTHYQTAGEVRLPSGYGSIDEEEDFNRRFRMQPEAVTFPVNMTTPPAPVTIEPTPATVIGDAPKSRSILTKIAVNNVGDADAVNAMNESAGALSVPVAPVAPVAVPALPGGDRMASIQAMLAAYGPKDGAYGADLKAARDRAKADSDAFAKMLTDSMKSPEDAQSSKAEMYFRLAAAFGAPTKTGQFSENLGMVGKELGEYAKGKRTSAKEKLLLGLEAQKLKMASSKEDLNTLRALSAEEMKDKRTIATELIKDYIKSGEPQSAAGKQALDEGLVRGTPEYQARVEAIGNLNIEGKLAQINAALAGMGTSAATLALAKEKFAQAKDQQSKLTGPEVELKIKTEDMLGSTTQAMDDLKRAYSLNDNTFDTSVVDTAQRKLLEAAGSKDPKVLNTREQENLLQKGALAQLKSTFPGAISDAETKTLQALQGLGSKSKEERALIMKNAFRALKAIEERSKRRLAEITQGSFRETVPTPQGLE